MIISPSDKIIDESYIKDYEVLYTQSIEHPEAFWENIAHELAWFKPWGKILDWQYPYSRWFVGGETNIVYNALDRWLKTPIADKLALIWISQNNKEEKFTYRQLNEAVSRFANGLKTFGVRKGDRVTIYLPRIPHQFIAIKRTTSINPI